MAITGMGGAVPDSDPASSDRLRGGQSQPYSVQNEGAQGHFVIICDHAGRATPHGLALGVSAADMDRHIAWDIGAGGLSLALGRRLDAVVVRQPYSRLVIDCNRSPDRADAMPAVSDATPIPANRDLGPAERARRVAAIHAPYHARIAALLDARAAAGRRCALVLMHSFTPVMGGVARPWRLGVLHTGEPFALAVLARLRQSEPGPIGDNQPYAMDEVDYTAGRHGRDRGLDFVEIEVRQDLIAEEAAQQEMAGRLARLLPQAWSDVGR